MSIRFLATRDSDDAWRDEDRAMAHANYGTHDSLDEAKAALITAVLEEIDWLRHGSVSSFTSTARAVEIQAAIPKMVLANPPTDKGWSAATVEAAGLRWSLIRIEDK